MRDVAEAVLPEFGATVVETDVRDDPETDRLYRLDIPVLLLGCLLYTSDAADD